MATPGVARRSIDPRLVALPACAAAAASAGVGAVEAPGLALAGVVAAAFAAIAFVDLAAGVAVFAALTFVERAPGMDVALPLGRVGIVVLVVAALRRSGPLLFRERPFFAWSAVVLAAWAAASVLWAVDVGAAFAEAARIATGVALVFVVFAAIRNARDVRWVLSGYVAGALATVVLGVLPLPIEAAETQPGRLTGGVGDPNILAAVLLPALVVVAFAIRAARGLAARWVMLCAVSALTVALFLTQSRGGLVALAAALVAALFFAGPLRAHALAAVLVIAAVSVGYYAVAAPPQLRERVTNFTERGGTGRVDLWSVAAEVTRDHPLTGVGAGNFTAVEARYASEAINLENVRMVVDEPHVVHNTFLEISAELGLVGLVLLGVLAVGALALSLRAARAFAAAADLELEVLARGLATGLVALLVAFVFISGQAKEQLWLLLGVAFALSSVARRAQAGRRDASPSASA